jgi:hypothetical protein
LTIDELGIGIHGTESARCAGSIAGGERLTGGEAVGEQRLVGIDPRSGRAPYNEDDGLARIIAEVDGIWTGRANDRVGAALTSGRGVSGDVERAARR